MSDNVSDLADRREVPDATTTEAVIVGCPECDWTMTLRWSEVKPESGGTDQRAEYRAHYAIFHGGSDNLGAIVPGSVVRISEAFLEPVDDAGRQVVLDAVMVELQRAAGHRQFVIVVGDDLNIVPDEQLRAIGLRRVADDDDTAARDSST